MDWKDQRDDVSRYLISMALGVFSRFVIGLVRKYMARKKARIKRELKKRTRIKNPSPKP